MALELVDEVPRDVINELVGLVAPSPARTAGTTVVAAPPDDAGA